ncbi:MAG TPA: ParB/RepB/Spo0J family partition protein [Phycisphaerales bacterium]|nr:ParB/RepB/Spo0J family partition protein [Phycisphaerales bacterium]
MSTTEAPKPRRLGRGLSSLMDMAAVEVAVPVSPVLQAINPTPSTPVETAALSDVRPIETTRVTPSPFQPRRIMDENALRGLAESIKRSGVMQPIIVREVGGRYELVAGERRWRAATIAGLERIPALVRALADEEAAEWALVENIQREDLNPMERAYALRSLAEKFSLTQEELARRVGLERSTVANLIRLTELPPEIAEFLSSGALGAGHGKVLLSIADASKRLELAKLAATFGWSVRKLEAAAHDARRDVKADSGGAADPSRAAVLRDLERQVSQQLGTKVSIVTDRQGKRGRMIVEFYGLDHFDGLLLRMGVRSG